MSTNTLINSYNTIETKLIKIKELADKVWEHPYIKDNNIYQILAWADEKYPLIKWLKKKPTTSEEDAILHYLRTWEKEPKDIQYPDIQEKKMMMLEAIEKSLQYIIKKSPGSVNSDFMQIISIPENLKKVLVESGHIYESKWITESSVRSAKIARNLLNSFNSMWIDPTSMVFVDDIHLDWGYEKSAKLSTEITTQAELEEINNANEIVYESAMIDMTDKIFGQKKQKENYLIGWVDIIKNWEYTCAALDTALTIKKLQENDLVINVLDKKYSGQQKNMFTVLKYLFNNQPEVLHSLIWDLNEKKIFSLLFDENENLYYIDWHNPWKIKKTHM